MRHFLYVWMDCQTHKCLIIKLSFWHVIGTHLINWNQKTDLKLVNWNKSYDRFSRRYRSKTVRAREPFDAKSVRAFAILCVRNVHMYVFGNTEMCLLKELFKANCVDENFPRQKKASAPETKVFVSQVLYFLLTQLKLIC